MASSGSITEWFRTLTGVQEFGDLVTAAAQSPPGGNGLLALPYFSGERILSPIRMPRGVIIGLTLAHTRADIYRSLLEATAFGVRHNFAAFADAGAQPTRNRRRRWRHHRIAVAADRFRCHRLCAGIAGRAGRSMLR